MALRYRKLSMQGSGVCWLASPRVATGGLTDMGKSKTLHKKSVYHRQAKLSSAIGWHV